MDEPPMPAPPAPAPADDAALRRGVVETCRECVRLGLFLGTWGNVSVRIAEGMLVTPTRVAYETMEPEDLAVVSLEGDTLRGRRKPTSEMHLHRLVLRARPDIGALLHVHGPYSSVFAAAGRELPVVIEDMAQILGGGARCAPYATGGAVMDLAEAAREALGAERMAALLRSHGAVVGGADLAEALTAAQVLEKGARVAALAAPLGGAAPLTDDVVREERRRYLFAYGK